MTGYFISTLAWIFNTIYPNTQNLIVNFGISGLSKIIYKQIISQMILEASKTNIAMRNNTKHPISFIV